MKKNEKWLLHWNTLPIFQKLNVYLKQNMFIDCYRCDKSGSEGCSATGICRCKVRFFFFFFLRCVHYIDNSKHTCCTQMNVEGSTCSTCKQGTFHLSPANKDGCLSCFCMGVTQQCSSSSHYRDVVRDVTSAFHQFVWSSVHFLPFFSRFPPLLPLETTKVLPL